MARSKNTAERLKTVLNLLRPPIQPSELQELAEELNKHRPERVVAKQIVAQVESSMRDYYNHPLSAIECINPFPFPFINLPGDILGYAFGYKFSAHSSGMRITYASYDSNVTSESLKGPIALEAIQKNFDFMLETSEKLEDLLKKSGNDRTKIMVFGPSGEENLGFYKGNLNTHALYLKENPENIIAWLELRTRIDDSFLAVPPRSFQ